MTVVIRIGREVLDEFACRRGVHEREKKPGRVVRGSLFGDGGERFANSVWTEVVQPSTRTKEIEA
jgi:hypothetical protein